MKVALYSPYIPKHFGGGERYLLSIAEIASWSHETFLLVPASEVEKTRAALPKYEQAFGLNLQKVQVAPTSIGSGKKTLQVIQETHRLDVLFAITDGSVFPSFAKKSYLIVQVPWTRRLGLAESLKLRTWTKVLVYSQFVQGFLQKSWNTKNIHVVSPYVDSRDFHPSGKKEKIILSTGRFFSHTTSNSKRQDVLIDAYKKFMEEKHTKGWILVLVGNVEDKAYLESLKKSARGYHVVFATNISYDEVRAYCARASIYWHAAGYDVDDVRHPENTEHFGITTLEAMASGCIPLVIPKGGQQEILDGFDFFWQTEEELVKKTHEIVLMDESKKQLLSQKALSRAELYSKAAFEQQITDLIG